ncbi:acid phosphatase [Marmoricola endophyticus]|uniref:Acid phosphatase n=1 Tax=Marmoricola endophyticus TaxID=2040280 RepID=A0A917BRZ0_9ACTN|nr:HAD family acid phosphatase [Marmoricola endophyticus]GGF56765.1 acid phosphatase [Marmoricola endophyticus]
MRRLRILALALLLVLALAPSPAGAAAAPLPSRAVWLQQVDQSLVGSWGWLNDRAAARKPGEYLAVVMDIDNTSLQTYYAPGQAVPGTLNLAKHARALGMTVFFATGRYQSDVAGVTASLKRTGFPVGTVCGRAPREPLVHGKVRCRHHLEEAGWTVTEMIGNRSTDFAGGHWERRWQLPSYGDRLG